MCTCAQTYIYITRIVNKMVMGMIGEIIYDAAENINEKVDFYKLFIIDMLFILLVAFELYVIKSKLLAYVLSQIVFTALFFVNAVKLYFFYSNQLDDAKSE